MDSAAHVQDRLESVFATIHKTRMSDVPILNPRLAVKALGFREWNGSWLGVLITPWFINLMLLPGDEEQVRAWEDLGLGTTMRHILPAGRIEFLVGEEADLGRFQMCSLFSPVLEFDDQEAACLAGEAALATLMERPPEDAPPPRQLSRRALFTGSNKDPASNEERAGR